MACPGLGRDASRGGRVKLSAAAGGVYFWDFVKMDVFEDESIWVLFGGFGFFTGIWVYSLAFG